MAGFFGTIAARAGREPLLAAWVIDGAGAGARALYRRDGERYAELYRDDDFPDGFVAGRETCGIVEWNASRIFLEPIARGRKLVICGAGHVSMPVIRLGAMLGYEVTAIDDREAFADRARAAGADRVVCRPFNAVLDDIPGDASTAFVIMTREHAHDVECLRRVLQKPRAYAGMMGSRSRTEQVRRQLLSEGLDAVREAHMPIGLPIGSRTPEEIAVSVMAEVISVMNASDASEGFPPGMLEALSEIEDGKAPDAVLAMIVEKRGEAPRRPGTKLLARSDGTFLGTVGGGLAEARILEAARNMLREGQQDCRLMQIALKKGLTRCGGEIEVFMTPLQGRNIG